MKNKVLWIQMYDDFSGIDKIFLTEDEAKLYHSWCGVTADYQKHLVNEDFYKIIQQGKKK